MAISHLIIVGWKLLEQLPDTVSLADAVDVRDLIFGDGREVQVNLIRSQSGWDPGVLLQCAAAVIVGLRIIVTTASARPSSSSSGVLMELLLLLLMHIGREIWRKCLLMEAWAWS